MHIRLYFVRLSQPARSNALILPVPAFAMLVGNLGIYATICIVLRAMYCMHWMSLVARDRSLWHESRNQIPLTPLCLASFRYRKKYINLLDSAPRTLARSCTNGLQRSHLPGNYYSKSIVEVPSPSKPSESIWYRKALKNTSLRTASTVYQTFQACQYQLSQLAQQPSQCSVQPPIAPAANPLVQGLLVVAARTRLLLCPGRCVTTSFATTWQL